MISMTPEQAQIFAHMVATLAVADMHGDDDEEQQTFITLTPRELGVVLTSLMLADCCIPVRIAAQDQVRDLLKKIELVMDEQHPEEE